MVEGELTVVKYGFTRTDGNTMLLAGDSLRLLGEDRIADLSRRVARSVNAHPETMLPVTSVKIWDRIYNGDAAAVVNVDQHGDPTGSFLGFGSVWPDIPEATISITDTSTGLTTLRPWIEAGSMILLGPNGNGYGSQALVGASDAAMYNYPGEQIVSIAHQKNRAARRKLGDMGPEVGRGTTNKFEGRENVPIVVFHLNPIPLGQL